MGLTESIAAFLVIRFLAGLASAFVMVFLASIVFGHLAAAGRNDLQALHFGGVGLGIALSSALMARAHRRQAGLARPAGLWSAALSAAGFARRRAAGRSRPARPTAPPAANRRCRRAPALAKIIVAYGLFGFGYVVTATFLVAIVRAGRAAAASFEAVVWLVTGLAGIPSVWLWQRSPPASASPRPMPLGLHRRGGRRHRQRRCRRLCRAAGRRRAARRHLHRHHRARPAARPAACAAGAAPDLRADDGVLRPRPDRRPAACRPARRAPPAASSCPRSARPSVLVASGVIALVGCERRQNRHDCGFARRAVAASGHGPFSFAGKCGLDAADQLADLRPDQGSRRSVRILFSAAEAVFHLGGRLEPVAGPALVLRRRTARRRVRHAARPRRCAADPRPMPVFWSPPFLWFYHLFRCRWSALFYAFWACYSPHPWQNWSILGSGADPVRHQFLGPGQRRAQQLARPFLRHDPEGAVRPRLGHRQANSTTASGSFLASRWSYMTVAVLNVFFVSHYIFRWRTAMNDYLHGLLAAAAAHRRRVAARPGRHDAFLHDHGRAGRQLRQFGHDADRLPAAAGRAVDPRHRTCRSSARFPIRWSSRRSPGRSSAPFCWPWSASSCPGWSSGTSASRRPTARNWSTARTMPTRAQPPTLRELSPMCASNYFTLYFHYVYFNVVRYLYLQADNDLLHVDPGPDHRCRQRSPSASVSRSSTAFSQVPVRSSIW